MMPDRRWLPLLLTIGLSACAGGDRDQPAKGRIVFAEPSRRETRACEDALGKLGVSFQALPDRDNGGGCRLVGTVKLLDIGVPVSNLTAMRCGLATVFTGWVRNAVVPASYQLLGSQAVKVESMGTYACRNTVGTGRATLSGHAVANAVDVSAFILADGRRISILNDWTSPDPNVRNFLLTVRHSACRRFGTVLSPDYNAAHRNHLHLEADRANFCR